MKKLKITRSSPSYDELVEFYRKERDSRMKERYHALVLMHEIGNCTTVASIVKRSRATLQFWVNAFNDGGLEGIKLKKPPGRPSRLSGAQKEELKRDISTHPRKLGYDFSNWEGKAVSEHVKNKFGVVFTVRRCQYLLHELGFSLKRPRHAFPKADVKKQERFIRDLKKN